MPLSPLASLVCTDALRAEKKPALPPAQAGFRFPARRLDRFTRRAGLHRPDAQSHYPGDEQQRKALPPSEVYLCVLPQRP